MLGAGAAAQLAAAPWDSGLRRFKVLVAAQFDDAFRDAATEGKYQDYLTSSGLVTDLDPSRLTAIFLADVFRRTTRWLHQQEGFKDADLNISFNVCVPIDQVENTQVLNEFERIFGWAEHMSGEWLVEGNGFDPIEASKRLEGATRGAEERRVFAIPESVAEAASYFTSLQRNEGLHAIIDLGAGTTDVSIFNLSTPGGETKSYWFAARNLPIGTSRVEQRLIEAGHFEGKTNLEMFEFVSTLRERTVHGNAVYKQLEEIRQSEDYCRVWGNAYGRMRRQSRWKDVRVFLCGGGALLPYTESIFAKPGDWLSLGDHRYPVTSLPEPENYVNREVAPFQRMAVAYGLAIPKPQLDEYHLPSTVTDQTPPELPTLELDHEDLYPR